MLSAIDKNIATLPDTTAKIAAVQDILESIVSRLEYGAKRWRGNNTTGSANFYLAEMLMYKDDLSSSDREAVEQYLQAKWDLANQKQRVGSLLHCA